jgi:hypothetical protein
MWLSSFARGLRKLRPQVELQRPQGRKARALAPEQKRNVHPAGANEACQVVENAGCEAVKRPSCKWKGQKDADEALPEAQVARLVECHTEQKAGYVQISSPFSRNPPILNVLIRMKNENLSDYTIRFTNKALKRISKQANLSARAFTRP